ncbi:MAG: hypothetical protein NTX16_11535 [Actinobacteria bacterium]|nr:hypothetical protein [Actinomycetota bacterium]
MAHADKPYQLVPAEGSPPSSCGAGIHATTPVKVVSRDDRAYRRRA